MGSRSAVILKGALADRLVVGTAFLVVLLASTLVSAIPIYADAVAESSLRERLERAPATESSVQATVGVFGGGDPQLDAAVQEVAGDVFNATGVAISASGESEPFAAGGRNVVFGFFQDLPGHARLVTGRWPATGDAVTEVVVPEAVARTLDLRVGDRLEARSRLGAAEVSARLVGIYRPERVASAYWWGNPLSAAGAGPLVTTREAFFGLGLQSPELTWRLEPRHERIAIGEARELRRKLAGMAGRLNAGREEGQEFDLATNLPEILAGADRSLRLARAGVLVPSIQLALLAAYGLIVTAALLVERRRRTTESLRLRGAMTREIAGMAFVEAVLIALPAVAIAPWLAAASLRLLNYAGPLADIGLRLSPRVSLQAYALAAAAALVCVVALVLPSLRAGRTAVVHERRRLPLARFAQRTHLDLVLVALALLGYWQLRHYHGTLVENRGALEIDPFLVAAPALLLLAGGLLSLRLVPLTAALVERFLPSTQGPVAALGFWQLARRPHAYARSVLLLVLAVAIGVFALTYSRTWQRSQVDQAEYAAGADVLVEPSQVPGAPRPSELASAYRELGADPLPAATYEFDLGRFSRETGNLLAVDARRAGEVLRARGDFADRSLDEMLAVLATDRRALASVELPGKPTALEVSVRLTEPTGPKSPELPDSARRGPLAAQQVFVFVRDADGLLQEHRLGELRSGRSARFTVELARRLQSGRAGEPRYPLELVALTASVKVPYLVAQRRTLVVESLVVKQGETRSQRLALTEIPWQASTTEVEFPYERPRIGPAAEDAGSIRVPIDTGSFLFTEDNEPTLDVLLRPGRDTLPAAVPVLASDAFLEATDARVGQRLPLALASGNQLLRIAGSVRRFPTLDPAAPAVVLDLPTYLAVNFKRFGAVVQPSQWWLETPDERGLVAQLRAPPFSSLAVTSRGERERALLEDPIPLGVIGALALGFVVAAMFAAVGFAASATAAARARMLEFAVLRSLGLRTRQLSGWITIENGLVVALSLLGGTALGLVVAWLVLPYVALGTSGEPPVPPVIVSVPWDLVLLLEVTLLGALVVVAAFQVARIRSLRPAPVLRSGEGLVAP